MLDSIGSAANGNCWSKPIFMLDCRCAVSLEDLLLPSQCTKIELCVLFQFCFHPLFRTSTRHCRSENSFHLSVRSSFLELFLWWPSLPLYFLFFPLSNACALDFFPTRFQAPHFVLSLRYFSPFTFSLRFLGEILLLFSNLMLELTSDATLSCL